LNKNKSLISLDVRGNLLQDSQFIVKVTKKLIRNILATKKKAQKNDDEENDFIKEIMSEVLIQSNLDSMALATISKFIFLLWIHY